ncbi:spore germination protein GerPE [Bacillus swezeyi]|uniref:Spore gernimation protein GerPE n=1 Tax=Bacillus swezeyi TaxID=1925020 RepID=A0A1R1S0Q1_9BACI|nr:spore germination protein GerPE [Bacillus swezeyi]MEC1261611.1 spore germination protein GerPE [Bacillus swezeyi]MED2926526.1 spore germination protein GerPE [Bacillus swezeyi]MED2943995.1 spore germination protein GerPE [Bacillus swezeyi]MED2965911.1 spore germination protein GerPE [Bacillus swezeyi]MED2978534.1 spore germination protein GerPE [Bacillus swezeyi]
MIRTSKVKFLKVHSIGITSTLQIGDAEELVLKGKILAVQRYLSLFFGNEGSLNQEDFQLYRQPIPQLLPETGVSSAFFNEIPAIRVRAVKVTGISTSSVVQVGSTRRIISDSRVKHIRKLPPRNSQ